MFEENWSQTMKSLLLFQLKEDPFFTFSTFSFKTVKVVQCQKTTKSKVQQCNLTKEKKLLRKCDVRRKRKSLQLFEQTLTVNSSVIDVDTRRHNFLVKLSESVRNAVFLQRYLNQKTFFAAFSTKLLNLGLLSLMLPPQFSSKILIKS